MSYFGGCTSFMRLVAACQLSSQVVRREIPIARKYQTVVALVSTLLSIACSLKPQSHPVDTAPIPANVRISEECSTLGKLVCGTVSMLSGDSAIERRSACIAYTEQSGRRIEQCGSVPASYPSASNVPSSPSKPTKTAYLSWKDNSTNEDGFRVYRIVQNQMSKIAELGRTPLVSLIELHHPERATSWLLLIRLENLLQPRKPASPIDLTNRGCLCSVGCQLDPVPLLSIIVVSTAQQTCKL